MTSAQKTDRFGFLHIDLNSFFASVEQQLHPEYRGKPLGVCGTMADTGALIAASYEAKALGIHTLTKVGEAKRLCPDIILVNGSHTQYAEFSHKIAAAVERCCPVAHTPSIDEMVCQLIGREREPPSARRIALAIKQAIQDDVGETLRCSIGMAPNRYLAKIASDMQKPDGLIGLLPSQLPRAIAHLALRDLPGVGARTEDPPQQQGHHHHGAAARARPPRHARTLGFRLGRPPVPLAARRDTGDDGAPVASELQKSLGHSHVLGPEHRSDEGAWAVAHKLLHKAAMRLRMEEFYAGSMAVTIKYALTREQVAARAARTSRTHHSNTPAASSTPAGPWRPASATAQDTLTLLDILRKLWAKRPDGDVYERPFFVGVTLRDLIPESPSTRTSSSPTQQPRRPFRHHGQAQSQVRPHHRPLRRHAPRPRLRAHPHRLHPDPRPVRCRLHVNGLLR